MMRKRVRLSESQLKKIVREAMGAGGPTTWETMEADWNKEGSKISAKDTLVEAVEMGFLTWEAVGQKFLELMSDDDALEVADALGVYDE